MISLVKTLKATVKTLKRIDNKSFVRKSFSASGTWTAPYDGFVTCCRRAKYASAYIFAKDVEINDYLGMCSIPDVGNYGSISFPVLGGHTYLFVEGNCYEPRDYYIHY